MAFLYLYSLLGFACLKLVTPDFGLLANTEYRLEGAFRRVPIPFGGQCCMLCIGKPMSEQPTV